MQNRRFVKRNIIPPKRLWSTDSENGYAKKPPKGKVSVAQRITKIKQKIKTGMQSENYSLIRSMSLQKDAKSQEARQPLVDMHNTLNATSNNQTIEQVNSMSVSNISSENDNEIFQSQSVTENLNYPISPLTEYEFSTLGQTIMLSTNEGKNTYCTTMSPDIKKCSLQDTAREIRNALDAAYETKTYHHLSTLCSNNSNAHRTGTKKPIITSIETYPNTSEFKPIAPSAFSLQQNSVINENQLTDSIQLQNFEKSSNNNNHQINENTKHIETTKYYESDESFHTQSVIRNNEEREDSEEEESIASEENNLQLKNPSKANSLANNQDFGSNTLNEGGSLNKCTMFTEINKLRYLCNRINEKQSVLAEKLDNLIVEIRQFQRSKKKPSKPSYLPIHNKEQLRNLEEISNEKYNELVDYFRFLGGMNLYESMNFIIQEALTNHFCIYLTWSKQIVGDIRTIPIRHTKLCEAFYEALSENVYYSSLNQREFQNCVTAALNNGKQRYRNTRFQNQRNPCTI